MNFRCMPPAAPLTTQNITTNGRNYSAAVGSIIDVPDYDMPFLRGNGWIVLGPSGTTAQRPVGGPPYPYYTYVDTSLNKLITYDGATWRDYAGASV